MKTKIDTANKIRLYGAYLGTKTLVLPAHFKKEGGNCDTVILTEEWLSTPDLDYYLQLKPISLITEEDKEFCYNYSSFKMSRIIATRDNQEAKDAYLYYFIDNCLNASPVDYLRSKGYALTWMGLSVGEQINAGWIRLES